MPRYPNIEAERAKLGMTKGQLAEAIGVTRAAYHLWQTGASEMLVGNALSLARVLGKPVEYLLEERKDAESKSGKNA